MDNKNSENKKKPEENNYNYIFIIVLVVFFAYVLLLIGLTWPVTELSISKAGTFGDSFGVITSLFTGLAFAGLFITLRYQREDLNITREEFVLTRNEMKQARIDAEEQATERTFFSMLNTYNNLVENLNARHPGMRTIQEGRRCFLVYTKIFSDKVDESARDKTLTTELILTEDSVNIEALSDAYDQVYRKYYDAYQEYLGHYFRYLYRMFKYIDEDTGKKADLYSKILRSQFTNHELALLFYNGLSVYGKKFKPYLEKYAVFDNLPVTILVNHNHAYLYKKEAWGENDGYSA